METVIEDDAVFWQLSKAGYVQRMRTHSVANGTMLGVVDPVLFIAALEQDKRFVSGIFYGLHRSVGHDLMDFRSYNGALGPGSVQIVVDRKSGAFYADIDRFNPYEDVARFLGHTGEVIGCLFRKIWKR